MAIFLNSNNKFCSSSSSTSSSSILSTDTSVYDSGLPVHTTAVKNIKSLDKLFKKKISSHTKLGAVWAGALKSINSPKRYINYLEKLGIYKKDLQARDMAKDIMSSLIGHKVTVKSCKSNAGVYFIYKEGKDPEKDSPDYVFKNGRQRSEIEALVRKLAITLGLRDNSIPVMYCALKNFKLDPNAECGEETGIMSENLWNGNTKFVSTEEGSYKEDYYLVGCLEPFVKPEKELINEDTRFIDFIKLVLFSLVIGLRDGKEENFEYGRIFEKLLSYKIIDGEECFKEENDSRKNSVEDLNHQVASTQLPILQDRLTVKTFSPEILRRIKKIISKWSIIEITDKNFIGTITLKDHCAEKVVPKNETDRDDDDEVSSLCSEDSDICFIRGEEDFDDDEVSSLCSEDSDICFMRGEEGFDDDEVSSLCSEDSDICFMRGEEESDDDEVSSLGFDEGGLKIVYIKKNSDARDVMQKSNENKMISEKQIEGLVSRMLRIKDTFSRDFYGSKYRNSLFGLLEVLDSEYVKYIENFEFAEFKKHSPKGSPSPTAAEVTQILNDRIPGSRAFRMAGYSSPYETGTPIDYNFMSLTSQSPMTPRQIMDQEYGADLNYSPKTPVIHSPFNGQI